MAHSIDPALFDKSEPALPDDELRVLVPHRHEFQMLDVVTHLDTDAGLVVAYKDWDDDPWWARGHVPGMPVMPGVLMCEGGAQAATVLIKTRNTGWGRDVFVGLGGLEKVRFRGKVEPGARVHFASWGGQQSGNRLARYPAAAFCNGKLIMEMELIGVRF